MSKASTTVPNKVIGVAVIWNDQNQILIDRRRPEALLGGLWEFPGGKLEPGETIQECIKREIREELGIEIEVGEHLITVNHVYTHYAVTLKVHHCRHLSGLPQAIGCEQVRWVGLNQLKEYDFPQANAEIIAALCEQA